MTGTNYSALNYLYAKALMAQQEIEYYVKAVNNNSIVRRFQNEKGVYNYFVGQMTFDSKNQDVNQMATKLWNNAISAAKDETPLAVYNAIDAYVAELETWYQKVEPTDAIK